MQRPLLVSLVLLLAGALGWLLFVWSPRVEPPAGSAADSAQIQSTAPLTHSELGLAAAPTGGDFRLNSAQGPVDLAEIRGKVVLLYFGYTYCPDICPTNLAFIASALKGLSPGDLERVEVLFVSVDPERDELERLGAYAAYFHPRIRGLTGTPEQIAAAAKLYGAAYRRVEGTGSAMGYLVDHSAYTYVVDPQGRLARTLNHATAPETIVAVIRELLGGG